jgi:hypothetical protein
MVTTARKRPLISSRQIWKLEIINISRAVVAYFPAGTEKLQEFTVLKTMTEFLPTGRWRARSRSYRRFITSSLGSVISSIA